MRRVLIGVLAAVVAVGVGVVGVDFGSSVYAEYRLSRSVRSAAELEWDPFVAILGFPFLPQARRGHYDELEIRAAAVERPRVGRATLEATMHSIGFADTSWLIGPQATLSVGMLESRILLDSVHLGRYLGILDLEVTAPRQETNDATGGTTESGISDNHGLVFTGTPEPLDEPVSVAVDLSMLDDGTLVFTPTDILTGPNTADQHVRPDQRQAVLDAFANRLPDQVLPFGVAPTSQGVRGSNVVIEGITHDATVTLSEFNRS